MIYENSDIFPLVYSVLYGTDYHEWQSRPEVECGAPTRLVCLQTTLVR